MAYASRRATPVPERIEALPRRLVGRRPSAMQHSQTSSAAMCAYAPPAGQNRCAMEIGGERVLVDEEYEPLKTYFHDEEVSFVGKDISETYPC